MNKQIKIRNFEFNEVQNKEIIDTTTQKLKNSTRSFLSDKWMLENTNKISIYFELYKDLMGLPKNIFDIAGGISEMTPMLSQRNNYFLVDPLTYVEHNDDFTKFLLDNRINLITEDWLDYLGDNITENDYIVSNDFFPNVDQRLQIFLAIAKQKQFNFRITLTWFSFNKFYKVKRIDCEESMIVSQYSDEILKTVLKDYVPISEIEEVINSAKDTFFENKRKICILENF
jgi:hypothetical protein